MREIKFRYWEKKDKRMFPLNGSSDLQEFWWHAKYDWAITMQWTGLRDKKRKEIYEGDIIKYKDKYNLSESYNNGVVEFEKGTFGIKVGLDKFHDFGLYTQSKGCDGLETMEVIGNIYQHPELLK